MDWRKFCDQHKIEYREGGASSKRGNIYIKCPYCSTDKKLMGLSLEDGRWACWKNTQHSRKHKTTAEFIRLLIGCGWEEATAYANDKGPTNHTFESIQEAFYAVTKPPQIERELEEIRLPSSCFKLKIGEERSKPFIGYLRVRGYPMACIDRYDLHGCVDPNPSPLSMAGRIVLPIRDERDRLIAYTGRSVVGHRIRYLTLPKEAPRRAIYNANLAIGGELLIPVEGPFDAMKLDIAAYLKGLRANAVATLGLSYTAEKVRILNSISRLYRTCVTTFDKGAIQEMMNFQRETPFDTLIGEVSAKDPGALTLAEAAQYIQQNIKKVSTPT